MGSRSLWLTLEMGLGFKYEEIICILSNCIIVHIWDCVRPDDSNEGLPESQAAAGSELAERV